MKMSSKKAVATIALVLSAVMPPGGARADDETPVPSLRISVETDPLDFLVFEGWGAFVDVRPAKLGRWGVRLGGGVAYPPKALTEANGNDGWSFGYDPVGTVAVQRFFSSARGGLLGIVVLGAANIEYTGPSGSSLSVFQLQAQAGVGYRWYPFAKLGLVITPYLTLAGPFYRSREPTIDGETYQTFPVVPLPEILIGWELEL